MLLTSTSKAAKCKLKAPSTISHVHTPLNKPVPPKSVQEPCLLLLTHTGDVMLSDRWQGGTLRKIVGLN